MTANQIAYFNAKETVRHNTQTEKETNRHNVVTENETYRHNVATETETNRHNVITENETQRHNLATEGVTIQSALIGAQARVQAAGISASASRYTADLLSAHNAEVRKETERHNMILENLQGQQTALNARDVTAREQTFYENAANNEVQRELWKTLADKYQEEARLAHKNANVVEVRVMSDVIGNLVSAGSKAAGAIN